MSVAVAALDAVTIDAYGTLLELRDPVTRIHSLLPQYARDEVERAFRREGEYYLVHSHEGRDDASLADLQARCTAVFNDALGSSLAPEEYVGTFEYDFLPGALEAVATLRSYGLSLAVVANFDITLRERLAPLGVPVVTSAEAGVSKPHPAIFSHALERLGVDAERTLHIGDTPATDEAGAAAAGLHFAPAPLADAVARLG